MAKTNTRTVHMPVIRMKHSGLSSSRHGPSDPAACGAFVVVLGVLVMIGREHASFYLPKVYSRGESRFEMVRPIRGWQTGWQTGWNTDEYCLTKRAISTGSSQALS